MCILRVDLLLLACFGRRRTGCFACLGTGGLKHAGIQRSRHVPFVGVGIRRACAFRRLRLVGMGLVHHVRDLRLGVAIAHGDDLGSERVHVGQLRVGDVELAHHLIDRVDRLSEQHHAFGRQRQVGRAQTFEQPFQRRQQLRQQRDVDHRDRPVQRMHGAQQFFADRQFVLGALDGRANGLQVLRHFAAQDLQQHRVHRRHHRHRDDVLGLDLNRLASSSSGMRIGEASFRNTVRCHIDTRYAAAHDATDCFHGRWCVILQTYLVAGSQLLGGMHDRAERRVRRTLALQCSQQLRQGIDRVPHQRLHVLARLDRVVEHAVQHVLHFPRELAQHAGTDQSTRTLQGVERAADTDQ